MKPEILIVDDHLQLAEQYRIHIQNSTKISAIATDSPSEALEYLKIYPIKIVILDQKMPQKSGTEIFKELKTINKLVRAIMLTGEADADEVGDALKLGFCDYIHKSKALNELTARVYYNYVAYQNELYGNIEVSEVKPFLVIKKSHILKSTEINFYLKSLEIIDEYYVFPNSWKTVLQIDSGEKKTISDKIEVTRRVIIEEEELSSIKSKLGLSFADFKLLNSSIESNIQSKFKHHTFNEDKKTVEIVKEFALPPEPVDSETVYIKSRHYQRAQVYRKIQTVISMKCSVCNIENLLTLNLYQLTTNIATRQDDYYSDGTMKSIDTGVSFTLHS